MVTAQADHLLNRTAEEITEKPLRCMLVIWV